MNMKLFFAVMAAMPLFSMAQNAAETRFVINGRVTGAPEGTGVCVTDATNPTDTISVAIVKGDVFVLAGHVSEPNIYFVNFMAAKKKMPLFIGNDKMSMSGTVDDMNGIKVTGSPSNDDFMEFQSTFNSYFERLNIVGKMLQSHAPEIATMQDSLTRVFHSLTDTVFMALDKYVQRKPGSYVSAFALLVVNQLTEDVMAQQRRLQSLSAAVRQGYYAQYLQKQLDDAKIGAVGTDEIDFTQNDTAGNAVSLSSFKGKYVLVDFWASWCGPCRAENPNVVKVHNEFSNKKNFAILGVSLDKDRSEWQKAIQDDGLDWKQISDLKYWNSKAVSTFQFEGIPFNLLIDPQGKVIASALRGDDLENKLKAVLN
jgi:thiol-disulfide isomerase/thioredoxin